MIYEIFKTTHSRIPVYDRDRDDIVSLILAKDLIFVDPEDEIPVSNFLSLFGRQPVFLWHDDKLGSALDTFRMQHVQIALVRDVEAHDDVNNFFCSINYSLLVLKHFSGL